MQVDAEIIQEFWGWNRLNAKYGCKGLIVVERNYDNLEKSYLRHVVAVSNLRFGDSAHSQRWVTNGREFRKR
jgi:hypothetical protein